MDTVPGERRLIRRSRSDRVLGGVCAGLAAYFNVDPLLIRVAFIVLALAQGAGVVLYLLLWLVVPEEGSEPATTAGGVVRTGVAGIEDDVKRLAGQAPGSTTSPAHRQAWLGGLLIAAGAYLLAANLGFFWWWDWRYAGPALLILAGVVLLVRRAR